MPQTTGKRRKTPTRKPTYKLDKPVKPKYDVRQLEDAIINMYEDTTRFNVKPILTGEVARQASIETIEPFLDKITAVLDYHQVHDQFKRSFNIIHPEVKITSKSVKFESNGVPVHIQLIDNNRTVNQPYRNPVIKWFLTSEVYVPNK